MNNYNRAYTDITYILGAVNEEYLKKIPHGLIEFFVKNSDHQYLSKIDLSKPLTEQEISKETEQLICLLNLNYWCTSKEKQELLKKYKLNEQEIEEQLKNEYKIEFDKNINNENIKAITVIDKQNIFSKLINFIKRIIIKKK